MINNHIHTFNIQHTPNKFIQSYIKGLPDSIVSLIYKGLKYKLTSFIIVNILRLMPSHLKKYVNFIKVGILENQHETFNKVASSYPTKTKFVVLPLVFEHMGAGRVDVPYKEQLRELIDLKKSNSNECLPFVCIDPRMGNAQENLDFVKDYIENHAFMGIKLYPSLGYYPFDPRLDLVYKYAADNEIPILTHCSRGGVSYSNLADVGFLENPVSFNTQPNGKYHFPFQAPIEKYMDNTCDPDRYIDVLEKYKNLKICFAHFGFDDQETDKTQTPEWHKKVIAMMGQYVNVYTDISYALSTDAFWDIFLEELPTFSDEIKKKILYGTDFFMTYQEKDGEDEKVYIRSVKKLGSYFSQIANENNVEFLTSKIWEVPVY